jgi:hypothetical protein
MVKKAMMSSVVHQVLGFENAASAERGTAESAAEVMVNMLQSGCGGW